MIYDDGIVEIYSLPSEGNGNLPGTQGNLVGRAYFGSLTVGFGRFFTAKANHDRIDALIECWALPGIDTTCYAVIDSVKYNIIQVQYKDSDGLRVMQLSLERQNDEN